MATNYPTNQDTFSTKIDNETDVIAEHVNKLQDCVLALEKKIGNSLTSGDPVSTAIAYFLEHTSGGYRTHIHDGSADDGANIPGASLVSLSTITAGAGQIPSANLSSLFSLTDKNPLHVDDIFIIEDSQATYAKKKCKMAALKTVLVDLTTAQTIAGVKTLADNLNFAKKQAVAMCIENLTADPAGAELVTGRIWFRTDIS